MIVMTKTARPYQFSLLNESCIAGQPHGEYQVISTENCDWSSYRISRRNYISKQCESTILFGYRHVKSVVFHSAEFHVVSGALSIIHSQRGFSQLPSVWLQLSRSRSDYMVPQNLLTLSGPSSVPWVLTNGGLGSLQLIDLATDRLAVQKVSLFRFPLTF